jgi:hypothetical protein
VLAELLPVVLLLAVLACAVIRPFGWPEAVVAVPAAAAVVSTGAISLDHVRADAARVGRTWRFAWPVTRPRFARPTRSSIRHCCAHRCCRCSTKRYVKARRP